MEWPVLVHTEMDRIMKVNAKGIGIKQTLNRFITNVEKKYERKKSAVLGKNPISYYYLKGRHELNKASVDTMRAYLYFEVVRIIDSLGYNYPHENWVKKMRTKKNRHGKKQYTLEKESLKKGRQFKTYFEEKKKTFKNQVRELNVKVREIREQIKSYRQEIDQLDVERTSVMKIKLKNLKRSAKKAVKKAERFGRRMEADIAFSEGAEVEIEFKKGVTSPKIELQSDGFYLAEECDEMTSAYARFIVRNLMREARKVPDKSVIKVKANITGKSDGFGFQKKIKRYSGEFGMPLEGEYQYKAIPVEGPCDACTASKIQFEDKTIYLNVSTLFTNGELGFLRAYCFFNELKSRLKEDSIDIHQEDCQFVALEYQRRGERQRGVSVDMTIENLFLHNEKRIAELEDSVEIASAKKNSIENKIVDAEDQLAILEEQLADLVYKDGSKLYDILEEIDAYASKKVRKYMPKDTARAIRLIAFMDTYDPQLGVGAMRSLDELARQTDAIAQQTGLKADKKLFYGNRFKKTILKNIIKRLHCNKDDIVIFYFFGHGYRGKRQKSKWLSLFVGDKSAEYGDDGKVVSVKLKWVYKKIKRKKAQLALVIGEACNTTKDKKSKPKVVAVSPVYNHPPLNEALVKNLFLEQQQAIIMSSSKPDQTSWTTNSGGFFFRNFITTLRGQLSIDQSTPIQWRALLSLVTENVRNFSSKKGAVQEPQFDME